MSYPVSLTVRGGGGARAGVAHAPTIAGIHASDLHHEAHHSMKRESICVLHSLVLETNPQLEPWVYSLSCGLRSPEYKAKMLHGV